MDIYIYKQYNKTIERRCKTVKRKRKKRKPTTALDVRSIIIGAIVDFLVGLLLLLIDKRT